MCRACVLAQRSLDAPGCLLRASHMADTLRRPRAELAGPSLSWACCWRGGQGTSLTNFLLFLFLFFLTIFTKNADQTPTLPAQPPAGVPGWESRHLTVSQRIGLGGDSDNGVTSYSGWLISDLMSRNQACFSAMSITHSSNFWEFFEEVTQARTRSSQLLFIRGELADHTL